MSGTNLPGSRTNHHRGILRAMRAERAKMAGAGGINALPRGNGAKWTRAGALPGLRRDGKLSRKQARKAA